MSIHVTDEKALREWGSRLALQLQMPATVGLSGELGVGKTVLAQAVIGALGFSGNVKSPTYTLVETYITKNWRIAHLDLYRLTDPEELHFIGFQDIVAAHNLLLIEWPEKAVNMLPPLDLHITIEYAPVGRNIRIVEKR